MKKKHKGNYSRKSPAPVGVRPAKSLGQNFLIDEEVISAIVEGSGVNEKISLSRSAPAQER